MTLCEMSPTDYYCNSEGLVVPSCLSRDREVFLFHFVPTEPGSKDSGLS